MCNKTVYIGNLAYKITEENLLGIFERFGRVNNVYLVYKPKSDHKKGIAFVEMGNEASALKAVKALDGKIVDGRTLKVSLAKNNKVFHSSSSQELLPEKKPRSHNKKEIIQKKRAKRNRGLRELFDYIKK